MMRRRVVIPALLLASIAAVPTIAAAQYGTPQAPPVADASQRFSATQIDNLAGPVALYPDALLAQVLVASTFPDQIQDAADFVRAYGTDSIDVQSWDISVKAVAHYPSALNAMADKIDWTSALGKAYATQSSDVMASVQRLRRMAADQGNLNSSPQQNVVRSADTYQIVPVEPRVIYVPVYDPYVIYSRPLVSLQFASRYWSWGVGFPIGSWLIYDCDWGLRRVYYNGWSPTYYGFGGGWRQRSRPFIQVTNIYINPRYTNVYVNRNVVSRSVNYYNVDRYASVHSGRYFDTRRDGRYDPRDNGRRPDSRYAVRSDGNNGSRDGSNRNGGNRNDGVTAVRGGGYRSGNPATGNDGRGNDTRGSGNTNPARDGSGYGGRDDVNRTGNNGTRDGNGNRVGGDRDNGNRDNNGNRDGGNRDNGNRDNNGNRVGGDRDNGNRDNNGNRDGGNRAGGNSDGNQGANAGNNTGGDTRDGNGNRVRQANPRGTPPQTRRNEPAARSESQPTIIAPRRNESREAAPEQRQSAPEQRQSAPEARQSAPEQRRAEPRVAEPRTSAPERRRAEPSRPQGDSDSRSDARSARPRGGNGAGQ